MWYRFMARRKVSAKNQGKGIGCLIVIIIMIAGLLSLCSKGDDKPRSSSEWQLPSYRASVSASVQSITADPSPKPSTTPIPSPSPSPVPSPEPSPTPKPSPIPSPDPSPIPELKPSPVPDRDDNAGPMVWVTRDGKKYHSSQYCSNMKNPYQLTLSDARSSGRTACSKCY